MKKLTKLDNQLLAGLREKHPDATFSISSDDPDSPSIEFEEKKDADLSDEEREAIMKDVRKTEREFSTDPEKKKILKKRKRMIKKQKRIVMKQAINIHGNEEEEKEKGGKDSRESQEEKQQKENGQEGEEE